MPSPKKNKKKNAGPRADLLSKERIVEAAIAILDQRGEEALTFRALSAHLATGSGAIYWHVANKDELFAGAGNEIIARMISRAMKTPTATAPRAQKPPKPKPHAVIRTIALGVFDAIDAHPWVGTLLAREPWQPSMLNIFESFGSALQALGVPERAQFTSASVLVNYVIGVAGQNAANARSHAEARDRTAFLTSVAASWARNDPAKYPFIRRIAAALPAHDDREQFLAGIDLILAGIVLHG